MPMILQIQNNQKSATLCWCLGAATGLTLLDHGYQLGGDRENSVSFSHINNRVGKDC